MKITSAEFVRPVRHWRECPESDRPQIAFAGRSNVGKSSMINCLVNRKSLARTSRTPGRTREIHFYSINEETFWLVDLPGFGHAKVPVKVRDEWGKLIESYLNHSEHLRAIVMLIDARHGPQTNDLMMLDWLVESGVPFIPVLTKADKVPKTKRQGAFKVLEKKAPVLAACEPILFSAQTRLGKDALLQRIEGFVE